MSVMLGMASKDELNRYSGGSAGDQNGQEVFIRPYYRYPNGGWDTVLRAKEQTKAEQIAKFIEDACRNDNIGYDQGTAATGYQARISLYNEARAVGMDASKITRKCECDCSSLVAAALISAGFNVPYYATTATIASACEATRGFQIFRGEEYTDSELLLRRGDILLNTWHHVAVVTTGYKSIIEYKKVTPYAVTVTVSSYLQCRTEPSSAQGAATEYKLGGQSKRLAPNEVVSIWKESIDSQGQMWGAINAIVPECWIALKYTHR